MKDKIELFNELSSIENILEQINGLKSQVQMLSAAPPNRSMQYRVPRQPRPPNFSQANHTSRIDMSQSRMSLKPRPAPIKENPEPLEDDPEPVHAPLEPVQDQPASNEPIPKPKPSPNKRFPELFYKHKHDFLAQKSFIYSAESDSLIAKLESEFQGND